ncbi:hypothetical protein DRN69_09210 [Candidatus Pacearchaeota archaeon]|nr:MAG: hypothetical protein DRN69_09210 [Candidatus Pacearchaeota archaeon]
MQRKTNWLAVSMVVMTVLAFGVIAHDLMEKPIQVIPDGYVSQDDMTKAVNNAVLKVTQEKDSQIEDLTSQLAGKVKEVVEETTETVGYLIDEIFFETLINKELSDREINLVDTKVDFDGDSYDVEEVFTLDGVEVRANDDDFKGDAYLTFPTDSLEYKVVFDSELNTSLITDEETLVFSFLGNEVEVSKWDGNEITFSQGKEYLLNMGESIEVNGKTLTLVYVMGDSDEESVYVEVDGKSKEIKESHTKTVNGLDVEVKNVIYSTVGPVTKAVLVLGDEVKKDIQDGDEYEEDSIWEYTVDSNSIGLVLKEEFKDLDDDYKPLAENETLCLPNDYVCVRFDGVGEEDTEKVTFELDTKDGSEYVLVRGNFQSGLEDYEKLYINRSDGKFFDKDLDEITGTITVSDFDSTISVNGTDIVIEDFKVNLDLNSSSVGSGEDDVRTLFGILVSNPEDSIDEIDDNEWEITIPENQLESTITVM